MTELTILTPISSKVLVELNGEEFQQFVATDYNTGILIEKLGIYTVSSSFNDMTIIKKININIHKMDYIVDFFSASVPPEEPPIDNELIKELNEKIEKLTNDNKVLVSQMEMTETKYKDLETRNTTLRNSVASLTYDNKTLTNENKILRERNEKLVADMNDFIKDPTIINEKVKEYVDSLKGKPNGLATLNEDGLVDKSAISTDYDDVVDGYFFENKFYEDEAHTEMIIGEPSKLYIDIDGSDKIYYYCNGIFKLVSSSSSEVNIEAITNDELNAMWESLTTN